MNSGSYFIVRSGSLCDVVIEASGPTHALVKAIMKHRPTRLGQFMRVRPSGVFATAPEEIAVDTEDALTKAAASLWYNRRPDGDFEYAGAPARI